MPSKIGIANLALRKVGAKRITSFNEGSAESKAITDVYDEVRDEILAEAFWTFAMKRAQLATIVGTPIKVNDSASVIYAKPQDLIRVFYLSDPSAEFHVEGDRILANVANLKIKYVYRNDDPGTYYSQFVQAFATRLAHEVCFGLTESVKKAEALWKDYEGNRLPRAISSDSQQGTPLGVMQDEWFNARNMSGPGYYAPPGAQTWHPYW